MKPSTLISLLRWRGAIRTLQIGVRRYLQKFGYDIVRYNTEPLAILPLAVKLVVDNIGSENFFFIQIGANDGIRADPLRPLIEKYRFRGVMIEPLPDMYENLMANYEGYPGLVFVNAAISECSGDFPLYRFKREANVEDWFHGLATIYEKKLQFQAKRWNLNPEEVIEKVVVPSMTFKQLLLKHHIEKYNLLQVDTEGYDYKILQMALAEDSRPEIIHFENAILSVNEKLLAENLLRDKGYRYLDVGSDTIAMCCKSI